MSEEQKPVIELIVQKVGDPLHNVKINYRAAEVSGFLPIESQDIQGATQYIALSNIASFTVKNTEAHNIAGAFPATRIRYK